MTYSAFSRDDGPAGLPTTTNPAAEPQDGLGNLCVVTLNTWKCAGDYGVRLGLMAQGLIGLSPDLVLLQECFATTDGWYDTVGSLADATGLHATYHPARRKIRRLGGRDLDSTSGLALLSRWEPLESTAVPLPGHPADGERIAQIAMLPTMGRPLLVINLQLSRLDGADDLRRAQIGAVVEALGHYPAEATILLGGDFNDGPGSAPLRWLAAESGLRVNGSCDPGSTGMPFSTLNPVAIGAIPNDAPCLDHLFLMTAMAPPTYAVAEVRRVLDRRDPRSGSFPSDHAGVCLRVRRAS